MKVTKKRYILGFGIIVIFLFLIRCIFPSVTKPRLPKTDSHIVHNTISITGDSVKKGMNIPVSVTKNVSSHFFDVLGNPVKHRIFSVPCFQDAFPDSNSVQMQSAKKYGVSPVSNRAEAESRKKELVFVGSNPFYYVDRLHSSIPYLVPRASILLQQIGHNFYDSLQIKGIPLHKIIVTSVMRSKEDIMHLRGHNGNATQNSCHLYGTTFDVCYNRYKTIQDPGGPARRKVRNDTLKWVLSEVLNDMRKNGQCYIKYEVHQGCFHITAK
jgi:hypothetical protein